MNEHNELTSGSGSLATQLKDSLREIRKLLNAVSDQLWTSIDHNDNAEVMRGVERKQTFNEWRSTLDSAAEQLIIMAESLPQAKTAATTREPRTAIPPRRRRTANSPVSFILEGVEVSGIYNWRDAYDRLMLTLYKRDPRTFDSLLDDPNYVSQNGKPEFSLDPTSYKRPAAAPNGTYYESYVSSGTIHHRMYRIIEAFGIPKSRFQLILSDED